MRTPDWATRGSAGEELNIEIWTFVLATTALRDVPDDLVIVAPGRSLQQWEGCICSYRGQARERYIFVLSDMVIVAKDSLKSLVWLRTDKSLCSVVRQRLSDYVLHDRVHTMWPRHACCLSIAMTVLRAIRIFPATADSG